jgi:hypothetical protein
MLLGYLKVAPTGLARQPQWKLSRYANVPPRV